jgi:hypothetical protein
LDYNDDAMADIFGKNLGNENLGSQNVTFTCDFYFEAA